MGGARVVAWAVWVAAWVPSCHAAPSPSGQMFSQAHFGFSLDLYTALVNTSGKDAGNVLFSPVGVAAVLSPLLRSADPVVSQQIREVLRYSNMSTADIEGGQTAMLAHFEDAYYSDVLQLGYTVFLPPLNAIMSNLYPAGVAQRVDFLGNATETTRRVNEWASQVTENRVGAVGGRAEVVTAAAEDAAVAAVAMAFSGLWLHGFQPNLTFDQGLFYTTALERYEIPMMVGRLELPLGYFPALEVRVLELPLARRRASMFILLPDHPDRGLAPLEHNMTQDNIKALFSTLKDERVNLRLPRFRVEATPPLKAALTSLGLTSVFPSPLHGLWHSLTPTWLVYT